MPSRDRTPEDPDAWRQYIAAIESAMMSKPIDDDQDGYWGHLEGTGIGIGDGNAAGEDDLRGEGVEDWPEGPPDDEYRGEDNLHGEGVEHWPEGLPDDEYRGESGFPDGEYTGESGFPDESTEAWDAKLEAWTAELPGNGYRRDDSVFPEPWFLRSVFSASESRISRVFGSRVCALRSRAAEFSPRRMPPLNITGLPLDILRLIFDAFGEPATGRRGYAVSWSRYNAVATIERRKTIGNARLACRLFWQHASPLMFPVLRLQVTQSSLDLADRISRSPLVAFGVRGILISLASWPKQLADEKAGLAACCVTALQKLPWGGPSFRGGWFRRPAGAGWSEALQCVDVRRVEKEWRPLTLAHAWEDVEDIAFVSQRPFSEYQQVLDDGHREFVRLHQEQLRLINDGSFVKTLASAVARMGNVASLLMGDHMAAKTKHPPAWLSDPDTLGVSSAELLTRFISHPITWREIASKAKGPTELPTARLLWELPIALREADAPPLRELHLHVVPRYGNFATLSPAAYYPP